MASDGTRTSAATTSPGRTRLAGFEFDLLTEAEVIDHIVSESRAGRRLGRHAEHRYLPAPAGTQPCVTWCVCDAGCS